MGAERAALTCVRMVVVALETFFMRLDCSVVLKLYAFFCAMPRLSAADHASMLAPRNTNLQQGGVWGNVAQCMNVRPAELRSIFHHGLDVRGSEVARPVLRSVGQHHHQHSWALHRGLQACVCGYVDRFARTSSSVPSCRRYASVRWMVAPRASRKLVPPLGA